MDSLGSPDPVPALELLSRSTLGVDRFVTGAQRFKGKASDMR